MLRAILLLIPITKCVGCSKGHLGRFAGAEKAHDEIGDAHTEFVEGGSSVECHLGLTSKAHLYSIISSAMESTPGDTSMNSSSRHGSITVRDV
jgi:hypothetical protein